MSIFRRVANTTAFRRVSTKVGSEGSEKGNYPAALRVTAPLFPSVATIATVVLYLGSDEVAKIYGITGGTWQEMSGDFAVLAGLAIGIIVWLAVAWLHLPYTAAYFVSRRNYNGLLERLDLLKIRVDEAERFLSRTSSTNGDLARIREQAVALARSERDVIEKGLRGKGMPWVTGMGYIDLWHRIHRADEALIRVEPCSEVLEGALRDKTRLENANMENRASLLDTLKKARNELVGKNGRVSPDALTKLSGVRYEINNFRDNTWEGLVNLRNRLADTVVLLGLATYLLLIFAIFLEPNPNVIIWAVTYFLVGAIAGLFARAQAEWGSETAVDDFGLSKTKLLQIPWLSGLAATGGVLVTSILDPKSNIIDLTTVFSNRPALLVVAAVFGVTPNLLVRKLDEQAEKTKEDLQSTQSSQTIEVSQSSHNGRRRSSSARAV
jgi:hypothetical protein